MEGESTLPFSYHRFNVFTLGIAGVFLSPPRPSPHSTPPLSDTELRVGGEGVETVECGWHRGDGPQRRLRCPRGVRRVESGFQRGGGGGGSRDGRGGGWKQQRGHRGDQHSGPGVRWVRHALDLVRHSCGVLLENVFGAVARGIMSQVVAVRNENGAALQLPARGRE